MSIDMELDLKTLSLDELSSILREISEKEISGHALNEAETQRGVDILNAMRLQASEAARTPRTKKAAEPATKPTSTDDLIFIS